MKKIFLILICFLTAYMAQAQSSDNAAIAVQLVTKNAAAIGFKADQLANYKVSSTYNQDGTQYVYLIQTYKGLPVFNQMKVLAFKNDKLISNAGSFIENLDKANFQSATPAVNAVSAIQSAFAEAKVAAPAGATAKTSEANGTKLNFGKLTGVTEDVTAELMWLPSQKANDATLKLVWQVQVAPAGKADWWQIQVDAISKAVANKYNYTVYEGESKPDYRFVKANNAPAKQSNVTTALLGFNPPPPTVTTATYNVVPFPYESPTHHAFAQVTDPWLLAGVGNNATTNGWHFDGTTNYNTTRGNNVNAYLDVDNTNSNSGANNVNATSTTAIPALTFNFVQVPSSDPNVTVNKNVAITSLFYWNNNMHDVMYQYGFTEVAGNFQTDNLSRGGAGNDYVQAEGQDGGGTNNANFATPADGGRPRMQMYLFDAQSPVTFTVNTPASIAGNYGSIESGFSTANKLANVGPVTAQAIFFNDDAGGTTHFACGTAANSLTGKIALIYRGTCNFTAKVLAAQTAGAKAVVMINNAAGSPIVMGGTDNTITIPAVMISDVDGATLAAQVGNNLNITLSALPGVRLDGDLDAGVMCHEYTHGISNRLTGGPATASCLSNAEQGGEGWSDYAALMMTTNWATATVTDGANARPMGVYVEGQPVNGAGIRNYPYSTNIAVNPLTYANVGTGTIGTEVHNIGEVWCMAIWEMTWAVIQQENVINTNLYNYNGTGGNSIALKLVLEGMKLQPCSPGFIDARNGILTADYNLYGGKHQCAIWTAFAKRGMGYSASQGSSNSATDQTAATNLPPAPTITTQPANTTVAAGSNATFTVVNTAAANGAYILYQWQVNTGSGFVNLTNTAPYSGVNTATLTVTSVGSAMTGYQYRCVLSEACASTTSNAGILTVSTSSTVITTQPVNTTVCAGSNATFTVAASGTGITYQWQVNTGSGYTNISNTAPYSGATTATLTITGATTAMNGYTYQVVVTATSTPTTLTSSAATLTVTADVVNITTQPTSTAVCAGANTTYTVAASGTNTYNWQVSTDGGTTWTNLSPAVTTQTLTLTGVTTAMNNNRYRAVVKGGCSGTATANSNAATLTVNTPASIVTQPTGVNGCVGGAATFAVVATGTTVTYQWQVSTDGGTTWANIPGATAASYTVDPLTTLANNNKYRVIASGVPCGSVTSNAVTLTVNPIPVVVLTAASNTRINPAVKTIVYSTVSPVGTYTYQWYKNGGLISNTTSSFPVDVDMLGTYKVVVTNTFGCTATSNEVTVSDSVSNRLFVYPNPSSGNFQVRYYSSNNTTPARTLTIIDAAGKRFYAQDYAAASGPYVSMPVKMRNAASGIYEIALWDASGKKIASGKVIISR